MGRLGETTRRLAEGWERFWYRPTSTSTIAVVRILFGLVALAWTISLGPDLMAFFSRTGIVPVLDYTGYRWSILRIFPSDGAIVVLYVLLLVACVLLIVGLWSRLAALVVFLGIMSFERRNPFINNSGDGLIRILAFYLALAPSGVALSLDQWRKAKDRFWEFPKRAPWALRLIQVQLSVLYVSTVWSKVRGTHWNDGTAVSFAMRLDDLSRFRPPSFITDSLLISNLLTFGTLAIEAALGILVWNRRARPWVLGLGVVLHLSIAISVMVGFFTAAILVTYVAFVPEETMGRLIDVVRGWLARSPLKAFRRLGRAGGDQAEPAPAPVSTG